jgi:hypothetical protein
MELANALLVLVTLLIAAVLLSTWGDSYLRTDGIQPAPRLVVRRDATAAAAAVAKAQQQQRVPDVANSNEKVVRFSALLLTAVDLEEQRADLAARAQELQAQAVTQGNSTAQTDIDTADAKITPQGELESRLQEALRTAASLDRAHDEALQARYSANAKLAAALDQIAELEATVDRFKSGANYSSRKVLYDPPTRRYKELVGTAGAQSLAPSCVSAL